jgi:hypothetical protein
MINQLWHYWELEASTDDRQQATLQFENLLHMHCLCKEVKAMLN